MSTTAEVLLDSVNPSGDRLTTFKLHYPRFILAEFNTHRALSRNTASSRAVPVKKMLDRLMDDNFCPEVWYENGKGMAVSEEADLTIALEADRIWEGALQSAVDSAILLKDLGIHKSYVNRLLEPFMYVDQIVSATEWENFFTLRRAPNAQPEFQALANLMYDAMQASTPQQLEWGDWHIPWGPDKTDSVARIARVSYLNHEKEDEIAANNRLYLKLRNDKHWSPFEHVAYANKGRCRNFSGFYQLRALLD